MVVGWWLVPLILVLRRLRQENCCGFKVNLGYIVSSRLSWTTEEDPPLRKIKTSDSLPSGFVEVLR